MANVEERRLILGLLLQRVFVFFICRMNVILILKRTVMCGKPSNMKIINLGFIVPDFSEVVFDSMQISQWSN